ncbi:MAG: hypothetical protein NW218_17855 [Saprospiraceae bacterium]|nr:hypothetical protein [Saprospiraceae bacterium]
MTLIQFLRLVARNLKWMLLTGIIAGGSTFWSSRDEKKTYTSNTILNTGLVTSYNISNSQGGKVDYGYTNNESENILGLARSRETMEVLAAQLLTDALMLEKPNDDTLTAPSFQELQKLVPQDVRQAVVVPGDVEKTLENVIKYRERRDKNPIKDLLESDHDLFGYDHLITMVIKREASTDMIRIAYTTTDPAVCRNTLLKHTKIFIAKHRAVKEGQSTSVLDFFESSTLQSAAALAGKEDELLDFMENNKIINFDEQTSRIAAKKEDIDEFYFKEIMNLAAADSSRRNIEAKLGNRFNLSEVNKNLMVQRQLLSDLSAKIANLQIGAVTDSVPNPAHKVLIESLKKEEAALIQNLRKNADATFAINRTPDGMETQALLKPWLENWLIVEQSLARLNVLKARRSEFESIYGRFASWGSKLKRIEREIVVTEQAYLENLRSFNQARLHKESMLMSTSLRVMDPPFYPIKAAASKRPTMIIMSFMVGMILVLALAITKEFMDNSLRDPERATKIANLKLAAGFPILPEKWRSHKRLDYQFLVRRACEQLRQRVDLDLRQQGLKDAVPRVAILSTRAREGKSVLINLLKDLPSGAHIEWIEVPALLSGAYPVAELAQMDVALLVADATRTWNSADSRALSMAQEIIGHSCRLVLNKVKPDNLETALGEIPKKRSRLRRWIKRLAALNLSK